MLPPSFNLPVHTLPSSYHHGGYPRPKEIIPSHFSPLKVMTQSPSVATTPPVNTIPTQTNNQIHREVNNLVRQSTSLADTEVGLTSAMETTTNTTITS